MVTYCCHEDMSCRDVGSSGSPERFHDSGLHGVIHPHHIESKSERVTKRSL